ncbi:kinesin-like protein KIF20A [Sphaerodactylus townsendi]|uniref:Kinesin-like protein kif20a n=1 Tax=Sphaerodactylus townsendi TaxID=933632 RepID=A0ACB8EIL4_9SAUR|nr:kinesin-like protein KIF20A [Sphaerodactylus townsendi]
MAQGLVSPGGLISDGEDEAALVLESTAAECGASFCRSLLPDFSSISSSHEQAASDDNRKVKVYARVRPLTPAEMEKPEDQGCICIENSETLLLKAPKDSFTMKNTERGIGQALHKFTFTQVFGPEVGQKAFFDATMKEVVKDVLHGQNWLVYTYGVTNSGKTYTVQGCGTDGGILPRSLAMIFSSIGRQLYRDTDLKPFRSCEVIQLDSKQVCQEETKKQNLLCGKMKEEDLFTSVNKSCGTGTSIDSGVGGLSSTCNSTHQTTSNLLEETGPHCVDPDNISLLANEDVQFSIWVSFFEIYNELIYDLLDISVVSSSRKRPSLRLCEDQTGNPYIKDLTWINVQDADEAWKLLKLGRRNQSFASTHMNQNSSRSHSIFSIRILHLRTTSDEMDQKISELSLCDLAGSERCKEQRAGDRMKEANNINTSLHTLGRCLTVLRQNQQARVKQSVVPFRNSKLSRVFQGYFTGRGQSCMIVNMSPCASSYDETLHVAKFSAVATQLIQAPSKVGLLTIQSLLKEQSIRLKGVPAASSVQKTEPDEESEDETDVTVYEKEDLMRVVEAVQSLLLKERQEKLMLEMHLRDEICNEMMEQLQQRQQSSSEQVDAQKEILENMYEDKLTHLKELLTDYYQEQIEDRDEKIEELEAALQEAKQQQELQVGKQQEPEEAQRRSKRVVAASTLQQELEETKVKLEQYQAELSTAKEELRKYRKMVEPPPSAKAITVDVDRKLEEGQKNVRMLRSELQRIGESLQSAERACCHSTSAGKLRETLSMCDDILVKQDQTLAELQNNMMLVKLDLRKKAACIAEQYHTVQKLQAAPTPAIKKRFCANNENMQPQSQPPVKKPFLHNFLTRSTARPAVVESPYSRILRSRRSPPFKTLAFGKKR